MEAKTNNKTAKRFKGIREKAIQAVSGTKYYNLMVGYDEIVGTEVKNILRKNGINQAMITDTYFFIKCLTKEEVDQVINLIKDVKFVFKKGTKSIKYGIIFVSATKYIVPKEERNDPKKKQITINTKKKLSDKAKQKIAEYIKTKTPKRRIHRLNQKKSVVFEHKNPRFKSSYEKKLAKRVKLAIKYIDRQEAKKAIEKPIKAKSKALNKPLQKELKFAS